MPGVSGMKELAALQFGDYQPYHVLVGPWHMGCGDDKAVTRLSGEPGFHLIGHLPGRTHKAREFSQGAAPGAVQKIPYRWIGLAAELHDAVDKAADTRHRRQVRC